MADESERRIGERRYRSLVDATTSIVWTADPRLGFVTPQPTWERYTGQAYDEYSGSGWSKAIHPDDRRHVLGGWRAAAENVEVFETEGRLWHAPSGSYRWCVSRAAPIVDERGQVEEWVGTCTDIHDQVVARSEAAASASRLATLLAAEQATRRAAEEAADRAERLGRVTVALAGALTAGGLADAISAELLPALDADTFAFSMLDQGRLRMVSTVGFPLQAELRLDEMINSPENPVAEAVRSGQPLFFESAADHARRYPHLDNWREAVGNEARAHLPLSAQGRVLGGLHIGFRRPRSFSEADRIFLTTVASVAAQALQRAQLLEAEQIARHEAEAAARRLRHLQEISDVALSRLPLEELVSAVRTRLRSVLSVDTVRILLLDENRAHLQPAALPPNDPSGPNLRIPVGRGFAGRVAAARGPIVLDDASTVECLDPLILDVASIAGVPLFVRDALVGVLHVGSRTHRRFTRAEVELLELAGERIAVAIDRSQAFEAQRAMARTLQAALLPTSLPVIPGVSLSTRYIAAGEGTDVGGDFYDVFGLGDCAWLAIVGDVCGRGPEAAAMTGLARHTVRAVAQESGSPAAILDRLNITLGAQGGDERFCTAVCARLEPRTGGMRVVLASGGHCRPLLLHHDGGTEPLVARGTMLGPFPDIEFEEIEVDLAAGDSLVLYTDGVVEAQGDDGLFGEARLGDLLAEGAGRSSGELAALIEDAVRRYSGGAQNDDLAVVVLQVARVPSALGGAPGADAPAGAHRLPPLEDVVVVGELDLTVAVPGGEIAGPAGLQSGEAGHHDPADEEQAAHDEAADRHDAAAGDDRQLVGHVARLPHPSPGEPGQEAAEGDDGDPHGLDPPVPSQFG